MRVLVCGGRDYRNRTAVWKTLNNITVVAGSIVVINGGAKGADQFAREWVHDQKRLSYCRAEDCLTFPAEWLKHGPKAGPIRNQQMIDEGKPDLVVAFPGGRGTADMVRRAKVAGIEVITPIEGATMTGPANKAAEGRQAFQRGLPREQNPYPHGTARYWQWSSGWLDERAFRPRITPAGRAALEADNAT